jgi:hypothetical protein
MAFSLRNSYTLRRFRVASGKPGTKATVTPACTIGLERLVTFLAQRHVMWSLRFCICESVTDFGLLESPAIYTAFIT